MLGAYDVLVFPPFSTSQFRLMNGITHSSTTQGVQNRPHASSSSTFSNARLSPAFAGQGRWLLSRQKFKYTFEHIHYILSQVVTLNPYIRNRFRLVSGVWEDVTTRFNATFDTRLNSARIIAMVNLWLKRFGRREKIPTEGYCPPEKLAKLHDLLAVVSKLKEDERNSFIHSRRNRISDCGTRVQLQDVIFILHPTPATQQLKTAKPTDSHLYSFTPYGSPLSSNYFPTSYSESCISSLTANSSPRKRISISDLLN